MEWSSCAQGPPMEHGGDTSIYLSFVEAFVGDLESMICATAANDEPVQSASAEGVTAVHSTLPREQSARYDAPNVG